MSIRILLTLILATLYGCSDPSTEASKPGSNFVGKWINEYGGGGLIFSIAEDGNHFLVKQIAAKNGVILSTGVGQYENGFLLVPETGIGTKIFYSEIEDALIFEGTPLAFRRKTNQQ